MNPLTRFLFASLALSLAPALHAAEAEALASLKAKGAEVTETQGVASSVSFRDCSGLSVADYAALAQLPQLKMLSLGKGCNDASLKALGALPELEMLSTNGMEATDDGVRALAACKKIKAIAFFHPGKSFTGSGLAALAGLPQLERLTVAGSLEFGDAGMNAVSTLVRLKEFRTWHNGVTPEALGKLPALKGLTGLTLGQRLSFAPPVSLTDATLAMLAGMPSLESIALMEARLSLPALMQLQKLPNLKRLTLDSVDIAEPDVASLKQQLPKTEVRWTAPNDAAKKRIKALFQPADK